MLVVGRSDPRYVQVASRERRFRLNEYLVVDDPEAGLPRGEVVESVSLNPLFPSEGGGRWEEGALGALRAMGFFPEKEEVHLARVRILDDLPVPVRVGSPVRIPAWEEIRDLFPPEGGFFLGLVRGTEEVGREEVPLLEGGEVRRQRGVRFYFPYRLMERYPHLGVFGGSGSGKSFALRVLLEEIMERRFPCLAFDPHGELDFFSPARPGEFSPDCRVFRVGTEVGVDFSSLTADELARLMGSVGELSEGMQAALRHLFRRGDTEEGFRRRIEEALERGGGGWMHPDSLNGLLRRLHGLRLAGLFQGNLRPLEEWLRRRGLAVVRGPLRSLQLFAAHALDRLYRLRRRWKEGEGEWFPPFFVVTDEAHHFVPYGEERLGRVRWREVAQEGRKYGVFLVLATQRPALLDETVTAQLNTKLVFRTVRQEDISRVRAETDLTEEELRRLPYLPSGVAFCSLASWGRSFCLRVRAARTASPRFQDPFEELEGEERNEEEMLASLARHLPLNDWQLLEVAAEISRELGRAVGVEELEDWLERLSLRGRVEKRKMDGIGGYEYHLRMRREGA